MGTAANKKRLEIAGYSFKDTKFIDPNDLIIALEVASDEIFQQAIKVINESLAGKQLSGRETAGGQSTRPRSLEGALRVFTNPNIVSISLPGEYAWQEAKKALEHNLHTFLFSDNVPIEKEVELKKLALSKGLLMMGPDCGTAKIGTNPLGFCNIVSSGEVGIVAASGTGAQEVMCILDRCGLGVSHVIGTGGRDLNQQVGGITSIIGLQALDLDPNTKVIILISKKADPEIKGQMAKLSTILTKPLIACFIGEKHINNTLGHGWVTAHNLDHAARLAVSTLDNKIDSAPQTLLDFYQHHQEWIRTNRAVIAPGQQYIRGLYSGGSLADEAATILADTLPMVYAGKGFGNVLPIQDWDNSISHMIVDLGDNRFTQGRPHPMIDYRTRIERFRIEANDPAVAVILLDVVLGINTHPNPAGELASEIIATKRIAARQHRNLIVIVHVCGTENDPQVYSSQVTQLEKAGCNVFRSNVEAALAAVCLVAIPSEKNRRD